MSVTDQQKRKLMFDLKLLKRKDSLKWDDTIKQLKDMSKGGSGGIDANGNSIRSIKYRNWNDQDFERVLEKVDLAAEENKISDSTAKETLNQTTDQFSYEKDSDDFVIIEGVKCLIVKKCDEKIKLKYKNYIDSRIGNLLKTDAIEERKQNCIDPYGLVSKKDSKDLIEPSIKIAVVTSAWKTHDYIEQFLDSIENNTMHPYVVLIGVDACEDTKNSLNEILNRKKYSFEIKTFYSNENVGTYNIRNNLNDLAFDCYDCDAIICMDSDDMIHPEYIRCAHDALVKNLDSVVAQNILFNFCHETGSKKFISNYCTGVNCFSKQIWKKIGYYLPIKAAADNEWIHRCMKLKQKILVSNSLLYYRRMHEKQLTKLFPVVKNNHERIKADSISQSNLILKPTLKKIYFENFNFINEYFDQVYCLNLDRRPDRMEKMQKRFNHFGIKFKRIQAIDGKIMSDDYHLKHKFYKKKLSKGELACTLGHKMIYEDALKNGYEKIAVFEDDAKFVFNFNERIQEITELNWDLVQLGASDYHKIIESNNGFYNAKNRSPWGTFAYAIKKECYKKILESMEKNGFYVADGYLVDYVQNNNNCYVFFPNICIMEVENSDLRPNQDQKNRNKKVGWDLIKEEII